jgi:hypothetical protein
VLREFKDFRERVLGEPAPDDRIMDYHGYGGPGKVEISQCEVSEKPASASEVKVYPQPDMTGNFGINRLTEISGLTVTRCETLDFILNSGETFHDANLTFSYLNSKGEPSTLSLTAKYVFNFNSESSYFIGSGPFPLKVGDKATIFISHVGSKTDTSNARMIEFIRTNPRITSPEGKQIREVAIGNFGDTVLTREDLTRRLEQGGNVQLNDSEIMVVGLNQR